MRPENDEHKHLISTDSVASHPPSAPAVALPEVPDDGTWFEDAYGTLSSDDRACLDKNLNDLANMCGLRLSHTDENENRNINNVPVDQSDSLVGEMELDNNNLMDEVMASAPFEELSDIKEVVTEDQISVMKLNMPTSPSLDIDADTSDIGHCEIIYTTTKNCKKSDSHYYFHVARDIGILRLDLKFTDIVLTDEIYIIRTVLVRKNEELKHFPGYFLPSQKTRCTKLQGGPNFLNFSEHHLPPAHC